MKYLGIFLDSQLSLRAHFEYIERKTLIMLDALSRLMPNL